MYNSFSATMTACQTDANMIVMQLQERKFLIERCQEIASAQCIRFTFLSGDVHVCAAGRLYSDPKVWANIKPSGVGQQ